MALYETVFIARQDLSADGVDELVQKLEKIITDRTGSIVSKEYWGLKKLAFKVKKNLRGHYVLLNIDAPYSAIEELKRIMSFNEDIIRDMTFIVESHQKISQLHASKTAKDFKPKTEKNFKKDPDKFDLIQDQMQFDI
jgi:small subunit ribosomal protein S6